MSEVRTKFDGRTWCSMLISIRIGKKGESQVMKTNWVEIPISKFRAKRRETFGLSKLEEVAAECT